MPVTMIACPIHGCLYISDFTDDCDVIHRVELKGMVTTRWPVCKEPEVAIGLSLTPKFNVLVACKSTSKLREFTTYGKQLREISLPSDMTNPWHAIELPDGRFVVCHGSKQQNDPLHRVCTVNARGHIMQSYGGRPGSATVGELNGPGHLAVDDDEFVYVIDVRNSRVLLLSPLLSYVGQVVSRQQLKWIPQQIHLDAQRRRLYIVDNKLDESWTATQGRIIVISF